MIIAYVRGGRTVRPARSPNGVRTESGTESGTVLARCPYGVRTVQEEEEEEEEEEEDVPDIRFGRTVSQNFLIKLVLIETGGCYTAVRVRCLGPQAVGRQHGTCAIRNRAPKQKYSTIKME